MALLTTFLSIPILLLLRYLLDGYASRWPGRGAADEFEVGGKQPVKDQAHRDTTLNAAIADVRRNSSAFGREVKKGMPARDSIDWSTAGTISQMAYAGKCRMRNRINL